MERKMWIGIDVGGTHTRLALVDQDGNVRNVEKVRTEIERGNERAVSQLVEGCRRQIEAAQSFGARVVAVGVGIAGKLDRKGGRILFSPNLPSMRDFPLVELLGNAVGLPVVMENDANVFGVGESRAGKAKGVPNWVGLTLGTGVGGCLIFNGKLWRGDDTGTAGEIGHMIVDPSGPRCACGQKGCLEAHASGTALVDGAKQLHREGQLGGSPLEAKLEDGVLEPADVYAAACSGDPAARRLFQRMGWALGLALVNLFTVLGLERAVIGGGVSASWDQFEAPLRESLRRHSTMLDLDRLVVDRSTLGDLGPLLGAAFVAAEEYPG
jgi:glucokinase